MLLDCPIITVCYCWIIGFFPTSGYCLLSKMINLRIVTVWGWNAFSHTEKEAKEGIGCKHSRL